MTALFPAVLMAVSAAAAEPAVPSSAPVAPPPESGLAPDPLAARRNALVDLAFGALAEGNLALAERHFREAAALPGPGAAAAADAAARVQRLHARRSDPRRATSPLVAGEIDGSRAGRVPVLLTTSALGLGLYGWALPTALSLDSGNDSRLFVGLYMLGASSSFLVPYLATRTGPVNAAQANLAFYGGTRGAWHGLLLTSLAAGSVTSEHRAEAWAASLMVGSVAELVGGYAFARSRALTPGQARTIAVLGDYGLLFGFGGGFALDFDEGTADSDARRMSAAGMVGAVAGLTGGYALARRRDNSWGDGEVMRAAGLLGAWTGLTVNALAGLDFSDRASPLPAMAGATLGLWAGDLLVRQTSFTVGQSVLVDLGLVAGGAGGAGLTYLFMGDVDDEEKPLTLAAALGAAAGFGATYWAMADRSGGAASATGPGVAVLPMLGQSRGLVLAGRF